MLLELVATAEFCREGDWSIAVAQEGLASESIYFQPTGKENSCRNLFFAMKKVAQVWEKNGVANYLTYTNSREQGWEMVPYHGAENSTWDYVLAFARQFEVMSRVIWGRYQRDNGERLANYTKYQEISSIEVKDLAEDVDAIGDDVFCKQEIINKQQIVEGESIRVLHDYAPLGEDKLHFLLMPKAHKEKFTDLSLDEFEEIHNTAAKIVALYPDYICYQYHKTGKLAGQTVKHFHHHLVFVRPQNEWQGQLSVFCRMVAPPASLSAEELKGRVEAVRDLLNGFDELSDAL